MICTTFISSKTIQYSIFCIPWNDVDDFDHGMRLMTLTGPSKFHLVYLYIYIYIHTYIYTYIYIYMYIYMYMCVYKDFLLKLRKELTLW